MPASEGPPALPRWRLFRSPLAGLVAGALVGCAPLPPTPPPVPPPPAPQVVPVPVPVPEVQPADAAARHLLAWQDHVAALGPAELAAEAARLATAPPSPQTQMDLALVLGATRAPGDTARAQALLDQVLRDPSVLAAPWQPLARLLAARLAEQRRAEDLAERLAQQLRDNQRRLDQLNAKLEALKAIERSLNGRAAPAAAASAARSGP